MKKPLIFDELNKQDQAIVDIASEFVALTEVIPMCTDNERKDRLTEIFVDRLNQIERLGYKIDKEQPSNKVDYGFGIDIANICPDFSFSHTELICFTININYSQVSKYFHYYQR